MILRILLLISLFFGFVVNAAQAEPIKIVAAESFYGELAQELGGDNVVVKSIMYKADQDPHLFSASPSVAKLIADADIIIYNGAAYDPWMERLIAAQERKTARIIMVANLLNKTSGDNPHLWYDPKAMPFFAKALVTNLASKDPDNKNFYFQQLKKFKQQDQKLLSQIATLKKQYQGTPIIATEPLFNYMGQALGLDIHGLEFQNNIMNDIAPTPSQISAFEDDLRNRTVKVLIYNNQVSNPTTQRMQALAETLRIPTVGMSEMQPEDKSYIEWMSDQLDELQKALQQGKQGS